MKSDVYQLITDRIIRVLEAGTVPWKKPWRGGGEAPQNFVSRKAYRGVNLFLLHTAGYVSPFWLTFKQAEAMGAKIKKGEKSFPVVFWKFLEDEENGERKKIPFLRYYTVFNVAQCEGIETPPVGAQPAFQPIEKCEAIISGMPLLPRIEHGHSRAAYSPPRDFIEMPAPESFSIPEAYYSVLFHELTHATGHPTRLGRKEVKDICGFGSDAYSREELVAEMGAAFLCGHTGIETATIDQSASYIENWLERLKGDRKLVVQAAGLAQKAADFILGVKFEEAEEPIEYQPKEFKVVALRECRMPVDLQLCDTPDAVALYWRTHIETAPAFNPDSETCVVLLLNTRRKVRGHHVVSMGTLDSLLAHPREVFRVAVAHASASVVMVHNHPSGDPHPSHSDIQTTRELVHAGRVLKIELLDHVIVGNPGHFSFRQAGYLERP